MINLIKTVFYRKRLKKGEIIKIVDKRKNLSVIGVYSKIDKGIVTIYMSCILESDVINELFFNINGLTLKATSIKKPNSKEITKYIDYVYDHLKLLYLGNGIFWKDPKNYKEGDEIIVKIDPIRVEHFVKEENYMIFTKETPEPKGHTSLYIIPLKFNKFLIEE